MNELIMIFMLIILLAINTWPLFKFCFTHKKVHINLAGEKHVLYLSKNDALWEHINNKSHFSQERGHYHRN
jgi:hypothetical protein